MSHKLKPLLLRPSQPSFFSPIQTQVNKFLNLLLITSACMRDLLPPKQQSASVKSVTSTCLSRVCLGAVQTACWFKHRASPETACRFLWWNQMRFREACEESDGLFSSVDTPAEELLHPIFISGEKLERGWVMDVTTNNVLRPMMLSVCPFAPPRWLFSRCLSGWRLQSALVDHRLRLPIHLLYCRLVFHLVAVAFRVQSFWMFCWNQTRGSSRKMISVSD